MLEQLRADFVRIPELLKEKAGGTPPPKLERPVPPAVPEPTPPPIPEPTPPPIPEPTPPPIPEPTPPPIPEPTPPPELVGAMAGGAGSPDDEQLGLF